MRTKYRCIYDVVYDVLNILTNNNGIPKTRLCSYSNIPLDRCNRLIGLLEQNGLIYSKTKGRITLIYLTSRGHTYRELYRQLNRLLPLRPA